MSYQSLLKTLEDQTLLNNLYAYAYKRLNSTHAAQDLCQEIIVKALTSARKLPEITHPHAYIWKTAQSAYVDFIRTSARERQKISRENIQAHPDPGDDFADLADEESHRQQLYNLRRRIAFLSKAYREITIMHYIDGMKIVDIAAKLNLTETAVKQRLFTARTKLKKEAPPMENYETLKPIEIKFIATGDATACDPVTPSAVNHRRAHMLKNRVNIDADALPPANLAARSISKNLLYICKNNPHSIKTLSEKLGVPPLYIEEEIVTLSSGVHYPLLQKIGEKYITNIPMLDAASMSELCRIYTNQAQAYTIVLADFIKNEEKNLLSFPFMSKQNDPRFILWALLPRILGDVQRIVFDELCASYFADTKPLERTFSVMGIFSEASDSHDFDVHDFNFYGENAAYGGYGGVYGYAPLAVNGYRNFYATNLCGRRLYKHFDMGCSINENDLLIMTLQAIHGIRMDDFAYDKGLLPKEKEIANRAVAEGYLKIENGILSTKIIIHHMRLEASFLALADPLRSVAQTVAMKIIAVFAETIIRRAPELKNEFALLNAAAASAFVGEVIESCIAENILTTPPKGRPAAEGVRIMVS